MFGEDEVELDLESLEVDPETGEVRKSDKPIAESKPSKHTYSASLIEDFDMCPAKAYGRVTRQPTKKGVSLVLGISVHEALEYFVKDETDPLVTFQKTWDKEVEKNSLVMSEKERDTGITTGIKCVAAGQTILMHRRRDGRFLYQTMDRDLVESFFSFERNGVRFVGKIDFAMPLDSGSYTINDYKTGKMVPTQYQLDHKVQFDMYFKGLHDDPKMKTFGVWAERAVWLHLRGKNIAKTEDGKAERKNDKKKFQYDFPTLRTQEQVETTFRESIDPVVAQMERNDAQVWRRVRGSHCEYMCGFFNKDKQRCEVEIPLDAMKPDKPGGLAPDAPLFGANASTVLTESRGASLKPYTGKK